MALQNIADDPIGIGIKYPLKFERGSLRLTSNTRVAVSGDSGIGNDGSNTMIQQLVATEDEQKSVISQALRRTVEVVRGEQLMEGQQGSLLNLVPFEVNNESTHNLATAYSISAIAEQVGRVQILDSNALVDPENPVAVKGFISYRIRRNNIPGNAVIFERSES